MKVEVGLGWHHQFRLKTRRDKKHKETPSGCCTLRSSPVFANCQKLGKCLRMISLDFENERYCREFGQLCHAVSGLRRWSDRIKGP